MTLGGSRSWNVRTAVAACPVAPWHGEAWRCHTRKWPGDNANGSLKVTGRFNRGRDRFPDDMIWPALYTGLAEHIALGETLRHTAHLPDLAWKRISHLEIRLQAVLDGTCLVGRGLPGTPTLDDLCHPAAYDLTHAIANAVRGRGAEALLIPTCTRFNGNNLIVFPDLLRPGSTITVLGTEDPDLYIDWDAFRTDK
jgi:hypothetical protein